jgi:histidyl-tRNA synthetase
LLLVAKPKSQQAGKKKLVYIIALGQKARTQSLKYLNELRKANIPCDTDYENKSLKGAMRRADDLGATQVIIIGDNELEKEALTLKDMSSGEQKEIPVRDLVTQLK